MELTGHEAENASLDVLDQIVEHVSNLIEERYLIQSEIHHVAYHVAHELFDIVSLSNMRPQDPTIDFNDKMLMHEPRPFESDAWIRGLIPVQPRVSNYSPKDRILMTKETSDSVQNAILFRRKATKCPAVIKSTRPSYRKLWQEAQTEAVNISIYETKILSNATQHRKIRQRKKKLVDSHRKESELHQDLKEKLRDRDYFLDRDGTVVLLRQPIPISDFDKDKVSVEICSFQVPHEPLEPKIKRRHRPERKMIKREEQFQDPFFQQSICTDDLRFELLHPSPGVVVEMNGNIKHGNKSSSNDTRLKIGQEDGFSGEKVRPETSFPLVKATTPSLLARRPHLKQIPRTRTSVSSGSTRRRLPVAPFGQTTGHGLGPDKWTINFIDNLVE